MEAELAELFDGNANDSELEEQEENMTSSEYKKLLQENENYRQELYLLLMRLKTSEAMQKDLQEANDVTERKYMEYLTYAERLRGEEAERYAAAKKEYAHYITNLQTNIIEKEGEIKRLQEEQKTYKDLLNEKPYEIVGEETSVQYEQNITTLTVLLSDEKENVKELKEKLANMEELNQKLSSNLHATLEQLAENKEALENAQESIKELTANLKEIEQSKISPASDTCKGNSLFAEVEDRRQILLDKMKFLMHKYNNAKRELNKNITEVKLLKAEKSSMIKKWEIDAIDSSQENENLLLGYKKQIVELRRKLTIEMNKNELKDIQFVEDNFGYTELISTKIKEIRGLNEKIENLVTDILVLEEANNKISNQLRYWQSKAMSLEAQIEAIKAAPPEWMEKINKSKVPFKAIEIFNTSGNMNSEKICDDSELTPDKLENNQGNLREVLKEEMETRIQPISQRFKKLYFTEDTKDTEHTIPFKKETKLCNYPIITFDK